MFIYGLISIWPLKTGIATINFKENFIFELKEGEISDNNNRIIPSWQYQCKQNSDRKYNK